MGHYKLANYLIAQFFEKLSVCDDLKVGVILPLFKGKGAKANNKDNYRGITLFPTLCKTCYTNRVLLRNAVWFSRGSGLQ